jgi:hypothetical protein
LINAILDTDKFPVERLATMPRRTAIWTTLAVLAALLVGAGIMQAVGSLHLHSVSPTAVGGSRGPELTSTEESPPKSPPLADDATAELPPFPWPPPTASASYLLPDNLFAGITTLGAAADAIVAALETRGYVERSFFATPAGGIALVTRLEHINTDGSSAADPRRWPPATTVDARLTASLYLRGLFFAEPGRYRVIVFILQGPPFVQSPNEPNKKDAQNWLARGGNVLPPDIAERSFKDGHCEALIYEFASEGGPTAKLIEGSPLTGKQHLEKAGLLALLVKPN